MTERRGEDLIQINMVGVRSEAVVLEAAGIFRFGSKANLRPQGSHFEKTGAGNFAMMAALHSRKSPQGTRRNYPIRTPKQKWRRHDTLGSSVFAILLASLPGLSHAQVNCDSIPKGPARTDCYLGLSQLYRGQSDLAAAKARAQSDAAWYRATTGTNPPKHKPHRR